jgi:crotonobetainyl-CoA:carnitine CoA-transferase CaiB-like acyl-CoA transferase
LEIILALVETCDVVVENFVHGKMESFGLGYERLKEIKPDLVYAAVRGFGRESP